MRDNDWVILDELDDLEFPPSGRSLMLRAASSGVTLQLNFRATTLDALREFFRQE